jgi:polypeptide N-acetylgalactosaminyltransferase
VLKKNSIRLAEVWLDDYKQYYYERINNQLGDFGNVSERKQLREVFTPIPRTRFHWVSILTNLQKLQCKPFKWFLDNIFPELFVPGESVAKGEVGYS